MSDDPILNDNDYLSVVGGDNMLRIFSFLSTREVLNVTETNRTNRSFQQAREVWQQRLRKDYGMTVGIEVEDAREFYINHAPLLEESKLLIEYSRAISNAALLQEYDDVVPVMQGHLQDIMQAHQLYGSEKALDRATFMANFYPKYFETQDRQEQARALYNKIFLSSHADKVALLKTVLAGEQENEIDEQAAERADVDLMIRSVGIFALTNHLKHLMKGLESELHQQMMDAFAVFLFKNALTTFNTEFIAELLALGLDANARVLERPFEEDQRIYRNVPLLQFIPRAIRNIVAQRSEAGLRDELSVVDKLHACKAIATLLLEHGADPDQRVLGPLLNPSQPHDTRGVVKGYANIVDMMALSEEEQRIVTDLLMMIADAPAISQSPHENTVNRFTMK